MNIINNLARSNNNLTVSNEPEPDLDDPEPDDGAGGIASIDRDPPGPHRMFDLPNHPNLATMKSNDWVVSWASENPRVQGSSKWRVTTCFDYPTWDGTLLIRRQYDEHSPHLMSMVSENYTYQWRQAVSNYRLAYHPGDVVSWRRDGRDRYGVVVVMLDPDDPTQRRSIPDYQGHNTYPNRAVVWVRELSDDKQWAILELRDLIEYHHDFGVVVIEEGTPDELVIDVGIRLRGVRESAIHAHCGSLLRGGDNPVHIPAVRAGETRRANVRADEAMRNVRNPLVESPESGDDDYNEGSQARGLESAQSHSETGRLGYGTQVVLVPQLVTNGWDRRSARYTSSPSGTPSAIPMEVSDFLRLSPTGRMWVADESMNDDTLYIRNDGEVFVLVRVIDSSAMNRIGWMPRRGLIPLDAVQSHADEAERYASASTPIPELYPIQIRATFEIPMLSPGPCSDGVRDWLRKAIINQLRQGGESGGYLPEETPEDYDLAEHGSRLHSQVTRRAIREGLEIDIELVASVGHDI